MWHLIAHFDGKIYDLGALLRLDNEKALLNYYKLIGAANSVRFAVSSGVTGWKSQLDFIKDYKTKHFMNAQLETPDIAARFENE